MGRENDLPAPMNPVWAGEGGGKTDVARIQCIPGNSYRPSPDNSYSHTHTRGGVATTVVRRSCVCSWPYPYAGAQGY
jgi:hypothetical protein